MPPRKAKKGPGQTWSGLDEDDITGQAEAEEAQMVEFGRRAEPKPDDPRESPTKERRCRKPKR